MRTAHYADVSAGTLNSTDNKLATKEFNDRGATPQKALDLFALNEGSMIMSLEQLQESLRGSLVALITPMGEDGAVDYAALERLIEHHITSGTDGLVIAGTTGESATLSTPEHIEVIRRSVEIIAGRLPRTIRSKSTVDLRAR